MRIDRPETDTAPSLPSGFTVLLLGSFLFSMAITFNRGAYAEGALTLILGGLGVLVICSLESRRPGIVVERNPRLQLGMVWIGLLAMIFHAASDEILIYPIRPWALGRKMQVVMLGLLFTYLPFLSG